MLWRKDAAAEAEADLETCGLAGPFPCGLEDGTEIQNAMELAKAKIMGTDEEQQAADPAEPAEPATAEAPADPATPAEPGEQAADAAGNAPAAVEEPVEEAAEAAEPAEEPVEAPVTAEDMAAEAEAEVQAEAPVAEAEAEVEAEAVAEPEVETTEAPAEPEMEATDAPAEAAEAPAEDDRNLVEKLADQLTGDDAEEQAAEAPAEEAPAEESPAEDMTAGERIEADTDAETAQAPEAEESVTEEPAAEDDRGLVEQLADQLTGDDADAEATAGVDAEADAEGEVAAEAGAAPEDTAEADAAGEVIAQDVMPEEPVEDAAPTAAAATESDADAEVDVTADEEGVVVEEVTAESTRSASEEYETQVAGASATNEGTVLSNTLNRDLTNFEKMVLVGLGGVAVGTLLNNNKEVVSNSGDRIVVQNPDGTYSVLKNDDEILRQPGAVVSTKSFDDGSTRTIVDREDGSRIITVRAADGTVLKRTKVTPDGTSIVLFDDTVASQPVSRQEFADYRPAPSVQVSSSDEVALREALMASMNASPDRTFSLRQIREYAQIRDLAPVIEVDAITFNTGSAVITSSQAEELAALGSAIRDVIAEVPDAVFLIEGHTDTVGNAAYNLALSDRRAESVALALTEYFDVPPENLITQGYGESDLKVAQAGDIRENRRANVRNITPLLQ